MIVDIGKSAHHGDAIAAAEGLLGQGDAEGALAIVDRALAGTPGQIDLLSQRAALLVDLRRFDAAIGQAEAILAESPDQLVALNALAVSLVELNRLGEAFAVFRRAFSLAPTNPRILANYANFLSYAGVHDAAVAAYEAASSLAPDDREIGVNRGISLLRLGQFPAGWQAFEQRRRHRDPLELEGVAALPPLSSAPSLARKRIVVFHEQGFGDSLQFLRYVPLLAARGAQVFLRMPPELRRIAATVAGCAGVIGTQEPIASVDFVLPMMSLPLVFATDLATIPSEVPYLKADAVAVAGWRAVLSSLPRPWIGLVWAGSPKGGLDHRRSLPFAAMAPIFDRAAGFVNLQLGEAGRQWIPPKHAATFDPTAALTDFADTAALLEVLDLVISVDTSTVHMAGALGRPVWVLDRFDSCWRWLSARDDSPWYPSLRLFRQPRHGDWPAVVAAATAALRQVYPG